jgi:hypothetical protein
VPSFFIFVAAAVRYTGSRVVPLGGLGVVFVVANFAGFAWCFSLVWARPEKYSTNKAVAMNINRLIQIRFVPAS